MSQHIYYLYRVFRSIGSKQNKFDYFKNFAKYRNNEKDHDLYLCCYTLENLPLVYSLGDLVSIYKCCSDNPLDKSKNYHQIKMSDINNIEGDGFAMPLYSIDTIIKLNIPITDDYIIHCILMGEIEVIKWCQQNGKLHGLFKDGIDLYCILYFTEGLLEKPILDWLMSCGIKMSNTKGVVNMLLYYNYNKCIILEWLKNSSDIPFEYTTNALSIATSNKQLDVLDWWKNSGCELKLDIKRLREKSIQLSWSKHNHSGIKWWYDNYGIDLGFDYDKDNTNHIMNVLDCSNHSTKSSNDFDTMTINDDDDCDMMVIT